MRAASPLPPREEHPVSRVQGSMLLSIKPLPGCVLERETPLTRLWGPYALLENTSDVSLLHTPS